MEKIIEVFTEELIKAAIPDIYSSLKSFLQSMIHNKVSGVTNIGGIQEELPTVGIFGIGRCGTNITLNVAQAIADARNKEKMLSEDNDENNTEEVSADVKISNLKLKDGLLAWLFNRRLEEKLLFLIDPVMLIADLDGDTSARVEHLHPKLIDDELRFQITDLKWLQTGGAGNIPVIGQYMALLALLASDKQQSNWQQHRSYIIDSSGLRVNNSRLYFYLFSCGGGSGSGMASMFGMAQQRAFWVNLLQRNLSQVNQADQIKPDISEPICSIGIGVLPDLPLQGDPASAQHYNAGRLICRYLSMQNQFDLHFEPGSDEGSKVARMFNCLLLVSNDIMKYALENSKEESSSAAQAENLANYYISQQIFNILTAQANIEDYDSDISLKRAIGIAGIHLGDTSKLDPSDLNNSLSGATCVAFAEQLTESEEFSHVLYRAIDVPCYYPQTSSIQGISILPTNYENYKRVIDSIRGGEDFTEINSIPLYKYCSSVVVIVSAPRVDKLEFRSLEFLKNCINKCFPSARIKRYAFVLGTSKRTSITLLISGSACSSREGFYHVKNYIYNCFIKPGISVEDFEGALYKCLDSDAFEYTELREMMLDTESLDGVLANIRDSMGNWNGVKTLNERRFAELSPKEEGGLTKLQPSVRIDEIMLKADDVIDALQYINRLEHQRPIVVINPDRY